MPGPEETLLEQGSRRYIGRGIDLTEHMEGTMVKEILFCQVWPSQTQTLLALSGKGLRDAAPDLDSGGLGVAVGGGAALDAVAGDREHGVRLQALHAALAARLESLRISRTSIRAIPARTTPTLQ